MVAFLQQEWSNTGVSRSVVQYGNEVYCSYNYSVVFHTDMLI